MPDMIKEAILNVSLRRMRRRDLFRDADHVVDLDDEYFGHHNTMKRVRSEA